MQLSNRKYTQLHVWRTMRSVVRRSVVRWHWNWKQNLLLETGNVYLRKKLGAYIISTLWSNLEWCINNSCVYKCLLLFAKKRKKKKRKMKNERVTASVSIIFYNTCLKTSVMNRYESKRVLFSLGCNIKYPWKFSWVPMESFGMGRSFSSDSVRGADFLNFSFRL